MRRREWKQLGNRTWLAPPPSRLRHSSGAQDVDDGSESNGTHEDNDELDGSTLDGSTDKDNLEEDLSVAVIGESTQGEPIPGDQDENGELGASTEEDDSREDSSAAATEESDQEEPDPDTQEPFPPLERMNSTPHFPLQSAFREELELPSNVHSPPAKSKRLQIVRGDIKYFEGLIKDKLFLRWENATQDGETPRDIFRKMCRRNDDLVQSQRRARRTRHLSLSLDDRARARAAVYGALLSRRKRLGYRSVSEPGLRSHQALEEQGESANVDLDSDSSSSGSDSDASRKTKDYDEIDDSILFRSPYPEQIKDLEEARLKELPDSDDDGKEKVKRAKGRLRLERIDIKNKIIDDLSCQRVPNSDLMDMSWTLEERIKDADMEQAQENYDNGIPPEEEPDMSLGSDEDQGLLQIKAREPSRPPSRLGLHDEEQSVLEKNNPDINVETEASEPFCPKDPHADTSNPDAQSGQYVGFFLDERNAWSDSVDRPVEDVDMAADASGELFDDRGTFEAQMAETERMMEDSDEDIIMAEPEALAEEESLGVEEQQAIADEGNELHQYNRITAEIEDIDMEEATLDRENVLETYDDGSWGNISRAEAEAQQALLRSYNENAAKRRGSSLDQDGDGQPSASIANPNSTKSPPGPKRLKVTFRDDRAGTRFDGDGSDSSSSSSLGSNSSADSGIGSMCPDLVRDDSGSSSSCSLSSLSETPEVVDWNVIRLPHYWCLDANYVLDLDDPEELYTTREEELERRDMRQGAQLANTVVNTPKPQPEDSDSDESDREEPDLAESEPEEAEPGASGREEPQTKGSQLEESSRCDSVWEAGEKYWKQDAASRACPSTPHLAPVSLDRQEEPARPPERPQTPENSKLIGDLQQLDGAKTTEQEPSPRRPPPHPPRRRSSVMFETPGYLDLNSPTMPWNAFKEDSQEKEESIGDETVKTPTRKKCVVCGEYFEATESDSWPCCTRCETAIWKRCADCGGWFEVTDGIPRSCCGKCTAEKGKKLLDWSSKPKSRRRCDVKAAEQDDGPSSHDRLHQGSPSPGVTRINKVCPDCASTFVTLKESPRSRCEECHLRRAKQGLGKRKNPRPRRPCDVKVVDWDDIESPIESLQEIREHYDGLTIDDKAIDRDLGLNWLNSSPPESHPPLGVLPPPHPSPLRSHPPPERGRQSAQSERRSSRRDSTVKPSHRQHVREESPMGGVPMTRETPSGAPGSQIPTKLVEWKGFSKPVALNTNVSFDSSGKDKSPLSPHSSDRPETESKRAVPSDESIMSNPKEERRSRKDALEQKMKRRVSPPPIQGETLDEAFRRTCWQLGGLQPAVNPRDAPNIGGLVPTYRLRRHPFGISSARERNDSESSDGSDNVAEDGGEIIHGGFGGRVELKHATSDHHLRKLARRAGRDRDAASQGPSTDPRPNPVRTAATEDTDLPDPLEGSVPLSRRLASGDNGAIGGAPTAIPTPSQGRQSTNRHDSIQETNATASRAADPAADSQKDGESDSSQADFASKNSKTKMRGGAAAESANSFPAFFDNASGGVSSNITRQPSPAAMQQHQANGVGAAGAAGSINMLNGLPQAGQQMDINILYNLVLQLSEELSNNRNHVSSLIDAVQRLQVRAAQEGISPTIATASAEINSSQNAASVARLTNELSAANRKIGALEDSNAAFSNLLQDHEAAMQTIIEKIRPYAHAHTEHTLALHKHYNAIIAAERAEKTDMRLEQQSWQAGLGRVAELARLALREEGDGRTKWVKRVAKLKQENRVLRKIAGVEEGWESSEDEMDAEGVEAKGEVDAVRASAEAP